MTDRDSIPRRDMAELASWKEISVYLGVTVRTAQNWERERGLPVQRLPGKRSLVTARPTELDAWRKTHETLPETPTRPRWPRWAWIAAACAAVAIGATLVANSHPPATPTGWQVSGRTFIVYRRRPGRT
jgi:hypothetical protein